MCGLEKAIRCTPCHITSSCDGLPILRPVMLPETWTKNSCRQRAEDLFGYALAVGSLWKRRAARAGAAKPGRAADCCLLRDAVLCRAAVFASPLVPGRVRPLCDFCA